MSEYGADPTGSEESSDGILKAVEDAFELQKSEFETSFLHSPTVGIC